MWDDKFTETRGMVTWRAAAVVEGRWEQALWLASGWAPRNSLGNPLVNYWYKPYVMLSNPLMRVRCKFAAALEERVLF